MLLMSMYDDSNKKIPLSPDDEIKSIRFAKNKEQALPNSLESICVAVIAGFCFMLLLMAIINFFVNFPLIILWLIVAVFVLFLYLYLLNNNIHVNIFILGSLTGLVAYCYSSDFYLMYPRTIPRGDDIMQFFIYGLVFLLFSFVFSYIFRKKIEQWQVITSLFLIVFILNSIITKLM